MRLSWVYVDGEVSVGQEVRSPSLVHLMPSSRLKKGKGSMKPDTRNPSNAMNPTVPAKKASGPSTTSPAIRSVFTSRSRNAAPRSCTCVSAKTALDEISAGPVWTISVSIWLGCIMRKMQMRC